MIKSRSKFFSIFYSEYTVYILTACGIIAALLEFIVLAKFFNSNRLYHEFIANIIFLNTLHTLFSFRLLRFQPFRSSITRGLWGQKVAFPVICALIFLVTFFSLFIYFNRIQLQGAFYYLNYILLALLTGLLPLHHTVTQAYGIHRINNSNDSKNTYIEKKNDKDKFYFSLLLGFTILSTTCFFVLNHTSEKWIQVIRWISFGLALSGAILIVANSIFQAGIKSKTARFSFRVLLLPFQFVSFSAMFFSNCCHGVEYFIVNRNIEKNLENTKAEKKSFSTRAIVFFYLILFSHFAVYYRYFISKPASYLESLPLVLIVSLSQGAAVIHYLMDRQFFKFKNPTTRSEISPLLKNVG